MNKAVLEVLREVKSVRVTVDVGVTLDGYAVQELHAGYVMDVWTKLPEDTDQV